MKPIELRSVEKSFHGRALLRNVSFALEQGKTYGLVGPNGSGKSVLLKIICGFIAADGGEVIVDPSFLSAGRTYPDRFGITIDGPAYLPGLTAEANLLELARIRRKIGIDDVREVLEVVGLKSKKGQRVRTFSMGMKQKLSLAQAFMEDPEVLVLDEPFNGLDETSVERIKEVLREFKANGKTILFTSHSRQDVEDLCDSVLTLRDETVVESAPFDP
jgi:ABC-2 type transport system ATP-binding protein